METEKIRKQGIIGSVLLIVLGFIFILIFAFRRDIFFWLSVSGWIVGLSGVVLLATFTTGWRGNMLKLTLGLLSFAGVFITISLISLTIRKTYELERFGQITTAVIIDRGLEPCWDCEHGFFVKIKFKDHKGNVVEYWHLCDDCIFSDSVLVKYSVIDPHVNEIVKPL